MICSTLEGEGFFSKQAKRFLMILSSTKTHPQSYHFHFINSRIDAQKRQFRD